MAPEERAQFLADKEARAKAEREARLAVARERYAAAAELEWGGKSPAMICPHCQTKGGVRTKAVAQQAGISGPKATAALITGGLSVLVTGLSREERRTQAHCDNCGATWAF
jgi:hypothetical protein